MRVKTTLLVLSGFCLSLMLAACGQTGPLYLPKAKTSQVSSSSANHQGTTEKQ